MQIDVVRANALLHPPIRQESGYMAAQQTKLQRNRLSFLIQLFG